MVTIKPMASLRLHAVGRGTNANIAVVEDNVPAMPVIILRKK
jgi:hypothetical protein